MANYIEMPKLADTMTEGTLVKWRKQEGDKVEVGDIVAEVETDKATMEMEAFDEGVLHKHLVAVGQKVPVGAQLALLLAPGEKPPAEGAGDGSKTPPGTKAGAAGKPEATKQKATSRETAAALSPASADAKAS